MAAFFGRQVPRVLQQTKSPYGYVGAQRSIRITSALPINDGKQIRVEFADQSAYLFHTKWMRDSCPSRAGSDYYRKSASAVFDLDNIVATRAETSQDGDKLIVHFEDGSKGPCTDEYVASWLRAFAPHVGFSANGSASSSPGPVVGTGSMFDSLIRNRRPWDATVEMPTYTAKELAEDEDKQALFLERMIDPGIGLILDVPPAESLDSKVVGLPLERLVGKMIGRLNQHPVRETRFGVMHTRTPPGSASVDYDHSNPLSMHTDHTVYHGTPGFLQFMYQAEGTVTSKVCDGLALAKHMEENHPEEYKLLTTINVTHSSRNTIYTKEGKYRDRNDQPTPDKEASFELVHTHPVIQLDENGLLEKVVQSETKRGVCALPYDTYEKYMAAYKLWSRTVEEPRWVKRFPFPERSIVVTNNWRVLHGRAIVPPGTSRTMVFGYVMKNLVDNRYRLLRQLQAERQNGLLTDKWLTRLPNQVLGAILP